MNTAPYMHQWRNMCFPPRINSGFGQYGVQPYPGPWIAQGNYAQQSDPLFPTPASSRTMESARIFNAGANYEQELIRMGHCDQTHTTGHDATTTPVTEPWDPDTDGTDTDSVMSLAPDDLPREVVGVLEALLGQNNCRSGKIRRLINDAATQRSRGTQIRSLVERRRRTAYTGVQLLELEKAFSNNHYLNRINRIHLANRLGLSETQIKVWFQNRRVKARRLNGDTRCSQRTIQPSD